MQRREFLKGGMAAMASNLLPVSVFAGQKQRVTWAPYQNLDLNPQDMVRDEDIALIIKYAKEFIPQSNTGRPPYDPSDPDKPGTERPLDGYGKRIKTSEISISTPNTYNKAIAIRQGLARLLAELLHELVREVADIPLALTEARQRDPDHFQPVQKILAELAGFALGVEILVPQDVSRYGIEAIEMPHCAE